jgi:hypothetical protein
MKKFILWSLALFITLGAAYYQRTTGPTYPKRVTITLNNTPTDLKLVRSLGLDERSEVKLKIFDQNVKARIFFKRYKSNEEYQVADFGFKTYPVKSFLMNKVFKITEEQGLFAEIPQQPAAGKIQYYVELTDANGIQTLFKESPVVIRFKGGVPGFILLPHILFMFMAMLVSTLAGLMAVIKYPLYRKYTNVTLILFSIGGMLLGPIVQKYAFGDFWTGIPFGWDLTDNKTLIALIFWAIAAYMNWKKERPVYTVIAAVVLMLVYSIPHSMFGSELNYESGQVVQGMIMNFF